MKYWGKWGAFWGGFWGLLFGAAFFWVPAVGPVLVGGPLVAWIVAGLENAVVVGGLSALGAGLYSIGIPKDSVVEYEAAVKAGKYVVVSSWNCRRGGQGQRDFELVETRPGDRSRSRTCHANSDPLNAS